MTMNVLALLVLTVLQMSRIQCANTGSLLQISRNRDGPKRRVVEIVDFYNIFKNQPNRQIDHNLKFRDTVSHTTILETVITYILYVKILYCLCSCEYSRKNSKGSDFL